MTDLPLSSRTGVRSSALGFALGLVLSLGPSLAGAQGADGGFLPDASVGEGGADRDQQEGEDSTGRVASACRSPGDCNPRFACQSGRCVYVGTRRATGGGCLGDQAVALTGVAWVLGTRRRHR